MATQTQYLNAILDRLEHHITHGALLEAQIKDEQERSAYFKEQLQHEREHREHTALRNQTLQIWKDHFENQSLAGRKVIGEALLYGSAYVRELARDFYGHYPELYPVERETAEEQREEAAVGE